MENPPKKFFRLSPGKEVRLRYAYFITCREVVKNAAGEVVELRCTYDPASRGGNSPDGRKVQATLHWVSAAHALPAEVRLYNPLFTKPDPDAVQLRRRPQPELARSDRGGACRAGAGRAGITTSQCSSSGKAISGSTTIRARPSSCSSAPSGCATPGRRCRPRRRMGFASLYHPTAGAPTYAHSS